MTLAEFFRANPKPALAFSGGTDSSYLFWTAVRAGADVRAYYVQSAFQPEFERRDAERLAAQLKQELHIVPVDILSDPKVAANPADRCYFCKTRILDAVCRAARADGCSLVMDGTNASDAVQDRPGMRALAEHGVISPLRLCGLTKAEIRRRSREAGLFTWNKPSYACLATRLQTGDPITEEKLRRIETAEDRLTEAGYTDFRARVRRGGALLQFPNSQLGRAFEEEAALRELLSDLFAEVRIDPAPRPEEKTAPDREGKEKL
jgi:uncharacterized protein